MSRPAWMPSGNEVLKQLVLAAIVGAVVYLWQQSRNPQP